MDPTIELCRIKNLNDEQIKEVKLDYFKYEGLNKIIPNIKDNVNIINYESIYVDKNKYNELVNIRNDIYNNSNREFAIMMANPYNGIGKSIFIDETSIILANIDALYDITGHLGAFLVKQSMGKFSFCDIYGGKGGCTQYIQYRRSQGYGYGITPINDKNWDIKNLDNQRIRITYGEDKTGDIIKNANWFSDYVRKGNIEGVDLVVAINYSFNEINYLEFRSSELILSIVLIALRTLRSGGTLVLKIFDSVSKFMADLIFILSLSFEKISIIKPMTSQPHLSDKFIICKNLNNNVNYYIKILSDAHKKILFSNTKITQLLETLPEIFTSWLLSINNFFIDYQLSKFYDIINLLNGNQIELPQYNLNKCLIYWNLPDSTSKPIPINYSGNGNTFDIVSIITNPTE